VTSAIRQYFSLRAPATTDPTRHSGTHGYNQPPNGTGTSTPLPAPAAPWPIRPCQATRKPPPPGSGQHPARSGERCHPPAGPMTVAALNHCAPTATKIASRDHGQGQRAENQANSRHPRVLRGSGQDSNNTARRANQSASRAHQRGQQITAGMAGERHPAPRTSRTLNQSVHHTPKAEPSSQGAKPTTHIVRSAATRQVPCFQCLRSSWLRNISEG